MIDTIILSRAQFGFTIGFHILFPTLNIGLALFLTIMEALWLKTKDPVYHTICKFWTKVFALTFGVGVVSGIVLSYELGTNFGHFTDAFGSVLGSLFTYEVLSAFFLEAGFLGVMLFGWKRVSPNLHFCATLLVMLGTAISAFWIMSANSWMQTPAGYEVVAGKYIVNDWWQVVFNPSFIPRFLHMITASYVSVCFVVAGISAWYLLNQKHLEIAKRCFSFALGAALVVTALQIFLGDAVGLAVHENQPLKTAAMEGVWDTQRAAPFVVFAVPDVQQEKNLYAIEIPYLASLINTHSLQGELIGLKSVAPADRPVISSVFFMFRIMVGIGFLLFFVALYGLWLRWRGHLYDTIWFQKICVWIAPLGFVSTIAGWMTTESGRQPWVVYHLMRTADAASTITLSQVATSFILFIVVYGFVFSFYLYYLLKLLRKGPAIEIETTEEHPPFAYMEAAQKNVTEN
jgi:cytochrome bd ubiquinol oxidase subunit I